MEQSKFKNMRTPFWIFVEGIVMILTGLVKVLSLGIVNPDWYSDFLVWKLRQMFVRVDR